jgi:hypothetical protein
MKNLPYHLEQALSRLEEAKKLSFDLTCSQAMDLCGAINKIEGLLAEIEIQNQRITGADIAVVDMLLEACKQ